MTMPKRLDVSRLLAMYDGHHITADEFVTCVRCIVYESKLPSHLAERMAMLNEVLFEKKMKEE